MKKILLLFLTLAAFGCSDSDDATPPTSNLTAQTLTNVSYGDHPQQRMDVYLPAGRNNDTKVFVLVHGGYWVEGSKEDMSYVVTMLQTSFPDYAIVNIDYRLATVESPGFPKQIEDIGLALDAVSNSGYQVSDDFALIGSSAGAHLSLLYAYDFDSEQRVKAVCSIVGPTDFSDPAYINNPNFQMGLFPLVGPVLYQDNPALYASVSPALQVTASAAPTIQFCAGQDELIPVSQGTRLRDNLDDVSVYNEYYIYPTATHGSFDVADLFDLQTKLIAFIETKF